MINRFKKLLNTEKKTCCTEPTFYLILSIALLYGCIQITVSCAGGKGLVGSRQSPFSLSFKRSSRRTVCLIRGLIQAPSTEFEKAPQTKAS